ncbi:anaphase-promoting complex subunit CDC26 isoform X2 [Heterocephalus glaber]|uniref:Anaphase-promoting complex subunit CDC26 n=1 Tax=Heterocephalus glaber TaxID=10181 RepID=A0AAX6T7N9_HETGA|nr:anaphase-promoting complex subunit CDC26 isoform X2 [Heterocephalus glaber]
MIYSLRIQLEPEDNSVNCVDLSMLRRKPTRLELKLDDIEEFENIRKDLEADSFSSVDASPSMNLAELSLESSPCADLSHRPARNRRKMWML